MVDLPDVQNEKGNYIHPVNAGVTDIKRPIKLLVKDSEEQINTIAHITLTVDLPHTRRGVNMSRLPIAIEELDWDTDISTAVKNLLVSTLKKTKAESAEVTMGFTYFVDVPSPVTDHSGTLSVECMISGRQHRSNIGEPFRMELMVTTPVMTLCPCSKAISDNGAHNQRAQVQTRVFYLSDDIVWIEDLIAVAWNASSSRVFPIIKRPDEKWITEHAYANPKFVEDVSRDAATALEKMEDVMQYQIQVISEESIHEHSAISMVEG